MKSQKRRRTASSGTKARQHSLGVKGLVCVDVGWNTKTEESSGIFFVLFRSVSAAPVSFVSFVPRPVRCATIAPRAFHRPRPPDFSPPCSACLPCCASRVPRKCLRARACSPCAASFRQRRPHRRRMVRTLPRFWPRRTRNSKSSRPSACWTLPKWRMCACARAVTWRMSARSH